MSSLTTEKSTFQVRVASAKAWYRAAFKQTSAIYNLKQDCTIY